MHRSVFYKSCVRHCSRSSHIFARRSKNSRICKYHRARTLHSTHVLNNTETSSQSTYTLPWPHHSKPFASREPFLNRLVGQFLLSSIARKFGHSFSRVDFLHGVSDAVHTFADILADTTRHLELEYLLAPVLYTAVKKSLQNLPENLQIHSEVESVRGAYVCSMNTMFGDAEPGDRHIVSWLGQSVVTSKSKLAALLSGDSKFTFNSAQDLGREAALTRLEFHIGVSFLTREKFLVVDGSNGRKVQGSNEFRDCFHFWKFSSLVDWDSEDMEYPFDWTIIDINNYIKNSVTIVS